MQTWSLELMAARFEIWKLSILDELAIWLFVRLERRGETEIDIPCDRLLRIATQATRD